MFLICLGLIDNNASINKNVVDKIYSEKIDQIYNIAETKYLSGISGLKFLKENYPIKRFGSAEEIAPFVALLASEHASFASGSIIPISGGRV